MAERVSGCDGWSRYPDGTGTNGAFHYHHDHAIRTSLPHSPAHSRASSEFRSDCGEKCQWNRE